MYSFFLFWHLWLLRIGDHRLICSPDSKTWLIYIVFFVFHVLPEPLKSTFHGLPKLRMHHFKIMQNKKFLHLSLPLFRRYDLLSTQAESNLSRIICSTFNDVCLSEVSIPHSIFYPFIRTITKKAEELKKNGAIYHRATLPPAAEATSLPQHQTWSIRHRYLIFFFNVTCLEQISNTWMLC